MKKRIEQKKNQIKGLRNNVASARKEMDKALNNLGCNARNSKIKQKMEQCMTDNGIDRAREHGGDLHGPHLIKFDNRSETIQKNSIGPSSRKQD